MRKGLQLARGMRLACADAASRFGAVEHGTVPLPGLALPHPLWQYAQQEVHPALQLLRTNLSYAPSLHLHAAQARAPAPAEMQQWLQILILPALSSLSQMRSEMMQQISRNLTQNFRQHGVMQMLSHLPSSASATEHSKPGKGDRLQPAMAGSAARDFGTRFAAVVQFVRAGAEAGQGRPTAKARAETGKPDSSVLRNYVTQAMHGLPAAWPVLAGMPSAGGSGHAIKPPSLLHWGQYFQHNTALHTHFNLLSGAATEQVARMVQMAGQGYPANANFATPANSAMFAQSGLHSYAGQASAPALVLLTPMNMRDSNAAPAGHAAGSLSGHAAGHAASRLANRVANRANKENKANNATISTLPVTGPASSASSPSALPALSSVQIRRHYQRWLQQAGQGAAVGVDAGQRLRGPEPAAALVQSTGRGRLSYLLQLLTSGAASSAHSAASAAVGGTDQYGGNLQVLHTLVRDARHANTIQPARQTAKAGVATTGMPETRGSATLVARLAQHFQPARSPWWHQTLPPLLLAWNRPATAWRGTQAGPGNSFTWIAADKSVPAQAFGTQKQVLTNLLSNIFGNIVNPASRSMPGQAQRSGVALHLHTSATWARPVLRLLAAQQAQEVMQKKTPQAAQMHLQTSAKGQSSHGAQRILQAATNAAQPQQSWQRAADYPLLVVQLQYLRERAGAAFPATAASGMAPATSHLLQGMAAYQAAARAPAGVPALTRWSGGGLDPSATILRQNPLGARHLQRFKQELGKEVESRWQNLQQQNQREGERRVQTQIVQQIMHGNEAREQIRKLMQESLSGGNLLAGLTDKLYTALEKRAALERYRKGYN